MVVERRDGPLKSFIKSPVGTVRGERTWSSLHEGDTVRLAEANRILVYEKTRRGEDVVTRAMVFEDGSWASVGSHKVNAEINQDPSYSEKLRWRPNS